MIVRVFLIVAGIVAILGAGFLWFSLYWAPILIAGAR